AGRPPCRRVLPFAGGPCGQGLRAHARRPHAGPVAPCPAASAAARRHPEGPDAQARRAVGSGDRRQPASPPGAAARGREAGRGGPRMIHRGLLFWSVAAVATAIGLFHVKYRVQDLEERIDRTNQKILESQEATHILRIEWAHLNEAERIERLAKKDLKLQQASIGQVVRLDSLKTNPHTRRTPPPPPPPRTGSDVPSSPVPGGGRVVAEAGSPSPASAPLSGRTTGPTTPPRPAAIQEPATPGPVGDRGTAAASI